MAYTPDSIAEENRRDIAYHIPTDAIKFYIATVGVEHFTAACLKNLVFDSNTLKCLPDGLLYNDQRNHIARYTVLRYMIGYYITAPMSM